MSKIFDQEIQKIQDEDLKKKLISSKKTLTPEKALQTIKSWRNWRVAFRVFISAITLGLFPLFYFIKAKRNWVTIPLLKTQDALVGIQKLKDAPKDQSEHEPSKEDETPKSEQDSLKDSESEKKSEAKLSSSSSSQSSVEEPNEQPFQKPEQGSLKDSGTKKKSEATSSAPTSSQPAVAKSEKQSVAEPQEKKQAIQKPEQGSLKDSGTKKKSEATSSAPISSQPAVAKSEKQSVAEAQEKKQAIQKPEQGSLKDSDAKKKSEATPSAPTSSQPAVAKSEKQSVAEPQEKKQAIQKPEQGSLKDSGTKKKSKPKSSALTPSQPAVDKNKKEHHVAKKVEDDVAKSQEITLTLFKPESVTLKFSEKKSQNQSTPQVLHNGLISFKCSNGRDTYFSAYEVVRDSIASLTSSPVDHGELMSFYPVDKKPLSFTLQSLFIRQGNTQWDTLKLSVIPRFFIPLIVHTNSRGDAVEAVWVFHHKKNHIAICRLQNGKTQTEEIKLSDNDAEDTIRCASAYNNKIYVGHTDGKLSKIDLNDDGFRMTTRMTYDKAILSIALDNSDVVLLFSDGTLFRESAHNLRKLDMDIPKPDQVAIGFRNEDLLIVSPSEVIIAKNVAHKQPSLLDERREQTAEILEAHYSKDNIRRQTEIEGIFITIFRDDADLRTCHKICITDKDSNIEEFLFDEGMSFELDFLRPFFTPTGELAFYYLNYLRKEIEFYNRTGKLLGSVKHFSAPVDAKIIIDDFDVQRGTGSNILLKGSFTVTEGADTTRYHFTESNSTSEKVADPAVGYSKMFGGSRNTIVSRDPNLVWATYTDKGNIFGCNRIHRQDGSIEYVVGLWPEKINHADMTPKRVLFLTKNEDVVNWTPVVTNEGKWSLFTYNDDSISIYDATTGKLLVKKDTNNLGDQLIPAEISIKDDLFSVTVVRIHELGHELQLVAFTNAQEKSFFSFKSSDIAITTANYDSINGDIYIAKANHTLVKYNNNRHQMSLVGLTDVRFTQAQTEFWQSLGITHFAGLKDIPITKIVLNAARNLMCLRFGDRNLRTYFIHHFDTMGVKNVGWSYVENASVFDMKFIENDNFVRFTTEIGCNDSLNLKPHLRLDNFGPSLSK